MNKYNKKTFLNVIYFGDIL